MHVVWIKFLNLFLSLSTLLTLSFSYLKFMKVYSQWVPFERNFSCIIWENACAFDEIPILFSST